MFARLYMRTKQPGWLAIGGSAQQVRYVGCVRERGARPRVVLSGSVEGQGSVDALERAARERSLRRFDCTTMLAPGQYQMLTVEGLNVPAKELRGALRWKVKDMLDYSVEEASIDALPIPAPGRELTYAVAARKEAVRACMERFRDARLPLRVIDILETAQRNIALLSEAPQRSLALLYLERDWSLLTLNYGGELVMARRLELGYARLEQGGIDAASQDLGLELQRSLDHFERQFRGLPLQRLLVAPIPVAVPLAGVLSEALGLPVEDLDLASVLDLPTDLAAPARQWEYFHLVGAALRESPGVG